MWFWNQKELIIKLRFLRVTIFLLEGKNENAYHFLWFGCLGDNWKWKNIFATQPTLRIYQNTSVCYLSNRCIKNTLPL
jgi:hypothetical protein